MFSFAYQKNYALFYIPKSVADVLESQARLNLKYGLKIHINV